MSAIVILRQRDAVHLMVDGVSYDQEGVVGSVHELKCRAYPVQHMVLASLGSVAVDAIFDRALTIMFESFDALVEGIEGIAPALLAGHEFEGAVARGGGQILMAGWSDQRQRLESYAIGIADNPNKVVATSDPTSRPIALFKLIETPASVTYPHLGAATIQEAAKAGCSFEFMSEGDEAAIEKMDEVDLLQMLELLRRQKARDRHWVGGHALLTTVTRWSIEQRVVYRWLEDTVGTFVLPDPIINWPRWRSARLAEAAARRGAPPESRLQREMREKRERKLRR